MTNKFVRRATALSALGLLAASYLRFRSWQHRWGATDEEVQRTFPVSVNLKMTKRKYHDKTKNNCEPGMMHWAALAQDHNNRSRGESSEAVTDRKGEGLLVGETVEKGGI